MVKTAVTLAGGFLSAVGAGLMVGVAVMETFVIVTVPEVGTCDKTNPIASIGVFTSSYDPTCANGEGTFDRIAKITSDPTLEFPLLFPSQENFGGALGIVGDFENCDTAWAVSGSLDQAALGAGIAGAIQQFDEGLKPGAGDQPLLLKELVPQLAGALTDLTNNLFMSNVNSSVLQGDSFELFVQASQSIGTLASLQVASLQGACADAPDVTNNGDFTKCSIHDTFSDVALHTSTCTTLVTLAGGQLTQDSCVSALGLYAKYQLDAPTNYNGFGGLNNSLTNEQQSWSGFKSEVSDNLNALATLKEQGLLDQPGQVALQSASGALTLLNLCPGTTLVACAQFYDVTAQEASAGATQEDALCTLIGLANAQGSFANGGEAAFNATFSPLLTCNFHISANVLIDDIDEVFVLAGPTLAPLLEQADQTLEEFKPLAQAALEIVLLDCQNTVGECVGAAWGARVDTAFEGLPADLSDPKWIPAAFTGADDAFDFVLDTYTQALTDAAVLNATFPGSANATAALETAQSLGAILTVTTLCQTYLLNEKLACITNVVSVITEAAAQDPTAAAAREGLLNAASSSLISGESPEERIKECKDDDQDNKVFATAQTMVPIAIGCAGVGVLVSFAAALIIKKMPVALVGGILAVIGGGILLGALLYIQSDAPVYQKLKESAEVGEVAGELYYQGGMAQILALAGIGASVLGGLVTVGSAFCAGDDEESQITAKVDGTY